MSETVPSKDRVKLARKLASLYTAAVALAAAVEEVEGRQPNLFVELKGSAFSVSAGNVKYGSKQSDGL